MQHPKVLSRLSHIQSQLALKTQRGACLPVAARGIGTTRPLSKSDHLTISVLVSPPLSPHKWLQRPMGTVTAQVWKKRPKSHFLCDNYTCQGATRTPGSQAVSRKKGAQGIYTWLEQKVNSFKVMKSMLHYLTKFYGGSYINLPVDIFRSCPGQILEAEIIFFSDVFSVFVYISFQGITMCLHSLSKSTLWKSVASTT